MPEDSNWAIVAALDHRANHSQLQGSAANRADFLEYLGRVLTVWILHAVQGISRGLSGKYNFPIFGQEFASAWRYKDRSEPQSVLFWLQPVRPFHHFAYLLKGVERFMKTKQATWPVERTLLTTGVLDAVHISRTNGGEWLETPYLAFRYTSDWNWSQPPPPPPVEE